MTCYLSCLFLCFQILLFLLVLYFQFVTYCNFSVYPISIFFSVLEFRSLWAGAHALTCALLRFWSPDRKYWMQGALNNLFLNKVVPRKWNHLILHTHFPPTNIPTVFSLKAQVKVTILSNLWGPFQCHAITNMVFTDLLNLLWNSVPDAWLILEFMGLRIALLGAQMSYG